MARCKRWLPLAWCVLTALLSGSAYWYAHASFADDLARQFQQQLPQRLALALQNRLANNGPHSWVIGQLERDLAALPATGRLPLLRHCRARVEQLIGEPGVSPSSGGDQIAVGWHIGDGERQDRTLFSLKCDTNWPVLLASQGVLALLLVGCVWLWPAPLSSARRLQIRTLSGAGIAPQLARRLSARLEQFNPLQRDLFARLRDQLGLSMESLLNWLAKPELATLDPQQILWLDLALHKGIEGPPDLDRALAVALAPAYLQFECEQLQVIAHGIPITLSKTPFFYFLWYARRRLAGDGWYLNPPTSRPDRDGAEPLITLMEELGGHNKSINDLREHGLRAKTLDQNRNKIRDELVSALGEVLVEPYLFESRRDMKSGRYSYRLALSADQIQIH
ncbi:hypothetical protein [Microbulbifer mangrovi]|uniref:hypothetical protein n=1 Tax=Microbulbifer mangrovi TaxID=927787 RepID=UPI0009904644|nr:hypothetical protein [Microbulbifer mangrovi]